MGGDERCDDERCDDNILLATFLEVVKTHMAANRGDGLVTAALKTYQRGGVFGFYQGLVPW